MSRYHRQQLTHHFSSDSQERLAASHVLVVGVGGLGCTVAQMLVGAGVGHVHLVDNDTVSLSNLHRQTLYTETDVGQLKTIAAAVRLRAINADVKVTTTNSVLDAALLEKLGAESTIVVECSDQPRCKTLVSQWSIATSTPCVIAAISHDVYSLYQSPHAPNEGVCWECLSGLGNSCETQGIIGPIAGLAANSQALAVLKRVLGKDTGHEGRYLLHDTHRQQIQTFSTKARASCTCELEKASEATDGKLSTSGIEVSSLDPNAIWVDIRTANEIAVAPLPFRALQRPANLPEDEWADSLRSGENYILICQQGVRSLKLATELQALGYRVMSLAGGASALRSH